MAKGHRSQIKRERNANKDTRPSAKVILRKSVCSESMLRIRCHQRQRCNNSTWYFTYNPRYASSVNKKLLKSAIANAENNNGMNAENLYIAECYANKGPTMKRIQTESTG